MKPFLRLRYHKKQMKHLKVATVIVLTFFSISMPLYGKEKRYIIGWQDKAAGLFHCFFDTLNKLGWCEKQGLTPIVYWDSDSLYFEKEGYNESTNVWEYYFEPVSNATNRLGEKINKNGEPKQIPDAMPIIGWMQDYTREKWYRQKVNRIISKYVKIKPCITKKIETFYTSYMLGKKTIGIHIRGTDKYRETGVIKPATIFEQANILAKQFPACQFLLATDELSILEEGKNVLQGNVIFYEAFRSQDGRPIHFNTHEYSKAKLGEEVLIETVLLSKTDIFLHSMSNVSSAVLYFNPALNNILFKHNLEIESNRKPIETLDIDKFWWVTI